MSTITQEPTITSDEAQAFVASQEYLSSCLNLRLRRGTDYGGNPIRKLQLGEGQDFTMTQGEGIEFREGRYVAREPEIIEWLDGHVGNGVQFHKVGFGADGNTADDSAALISDVIQLAFRGDFQKIADILIAERNSYKRPDVISACERSLNELSVETNA